MVAYWPYRELRRSDRAIAVRLGVTDKTAAKAIRWLESLGSSPLGGPGAFCQPSRRLGPPPATLRDCGAKLDGSAIRAGLERLHRRGQGEEDPDPP